MPASPARIVVYLENSLSNLQSALHSAQRQHSDLAAGIDIIATAIQLLGPVAPISRAGGDKGSTSDLTTAIIRSGRSVSDIAYLAGVPLERLNAIIAGEPPTAEARSALLARLADWMPKGGAR